MSNCVMLECFVECVLFKVSCISYFRCPRVASYAIGDSWTLFWWGHIENASMTMA